MTASPEIPLNNQSGYRYLYAIENVLRELIIDVLSNIAGPRWYKTRLPGDVLSKFKDAVAYERHLPWLDLSPHHPLYYLDFPDLKKIIEQRNNWSEVFEKMFISKNITSDALFSVEPIRNKIAHNRIVSLTDLIYLRSTYEKFRLAIGGEEFDILLERSANYRSCYERLVSLREELTSTYRQLTALKPVADLGVWKICQAAWWFDSLYIGRPIERISEYFGAVEKYRELPRGWGCALELERWVLSNDLEELYNDGMAQITDVLGSVKRNAI